MCMFFTRLEMLCYTFSFRYWLTFCLFPGIFFLVTFLYPFLIPLEPKFCYLSYLFICSLFPLSQSSVLSQPLHSVCSEGRSSSLHSGPQRARRRCLPTTLLHPQFAASPGHGQSLTGGNLSCGESLVHGSHCHVLLSLCHTELDQAASSCIKGLWDRAVRGFSP